LIMSEAKREPAWTTPGGYPRGYDAMMTV
jgi:hypothetical protein